MRNGVTIIIIIIIIIIIRTLVHNKATSQKLTRCTVYGLNAVTSLHNSEKQHVANHKYLSIFFFKHSQSKVAKPSHDLNRSYDAVLNRAI